MGYTIIPLQACRERMAEAAQWFSSKWGIPLEAYIESMEDSLRTQSGVPQWYLAMDAGQIIGGIGVIENDFHKRRDLAPNLCAIYVEEPYRMQGIASALMDTACAGLRQHGIEKAYLITTHTQFYECCGFTFYGMIEEDDGSPVRMYMRDC